MRQKNFDLDIVDILFERINYRAVLNIMLHFLDMMSDWLYFFFVPMYSTWYLVFFLLSMIIPYLITFFIVIWIGQDQVGIWPKFLMTMLIMLNVVSQLQSDQRQDVRDMFLDMPRIIFHLEDAPQFYLQLFNSIQIGATWSWLQVFSPMLTTFFLISRFIKPHGLQGWNKQSAIIIFIYLITVYLYIIFGVFYTDDKRPDWAKVVPNIRIGSKFI